MSSPLLDHPVVSERYFFPRRMPLPNPTWIDVPGARLACADLGPTSTAPVLLHFHGNGEIVSDWVDDFGPAMQAVGFRPWFAEYRGYGGSTGRPQLDTMLDDALAVADAIGVPCERMVVYGRSVGSLYALHVAANRPVKGLILESGIADVGQRLAIRMQPSELGTTHAEFSAALKSRFDHEAKLAKADCDVLILHTTHDHTVDIAHARTLAKWAGERGTLVEFPEGDHNSIIAYNAAEILDELASFRSQVGL